MLRGAEAAPDAVTILPPAATGLRGTPRSLIVIADGAFGAVHLIAMGNRNLRVNELLQREISQYVHRRLQSEAARVTITAVETTNDYKSAVAYFSIVGAPEDGPAMETLLNQHAQPINQELRRTITLRNIPRIRFQFDVSMERADRVLRLLDEIESEQKNRGNA